MEAQALLPGPSWFRLTPIRSLCSRLRTPRPCVQAPPTPGEQPHPGLPIPVLRSALWQSQQRDPLETLGRGLRAFEEGPEGGRPERRHSKEGIPGVPRG